MCFRTYFCKNKPREVESHNATISKIAGIAWGKLSEEERLPFVAQAAAFKAEFMAMHPDWRFRPRRPADTPKKRRRRTQQRTLADEQRYARLAVGFNSGKRGKDLKRLAEMADAATEEAAFASQSAVRRSRKSVTTKETSTTPNPAVCTRISPPPVGNTSSADKQQTHISAGLLPPITPVPSAEEPSVLSNLGFWEFQPVCATYYPHVYPLMTLCLEQDNCVCLPSTTLQVSDQLDLSSIPVEQDIFSLLHLTQETNVDSLMLQLEDSLVGSTPAGLFDGSDLQQQFSWMTSSQLFLDELTSDFVSEYAI
jgi:hypothetical protein